MKEPMDFVARIVNHEKPIYSLLYYRYKDNDVYKGSILSHLQKLLGYCLSVHSNFFYHERKNLPVKE